MANTKVTSHVIANNAISASMIQSAAVTDAKLHSTLDLSGKTLTLPATAIPSASTATTQAASDNSTKIATTAYVTTAISNLVDSAPGALDTLNELAAALGDDASFSSTVTTSLATKAPINNPTFTGSISHASDLTIDVAGDIVLDADGRDVFFADGGTNYFQVYNDISNNAILNSVIQDKDIKFTGNDGGSTITALTLDMSEAGFATFNSGGSFGGTGALKIPVGTTGQRPTAATGQIRWNSTDGALEVYNGSAWTAVGTGSSNKVLDTFTGNGSNTTFTLSVTPANEDAIMVFIDGAYQEKSDYILTNNSLALDVAPLSGEKIAVHTTTASVHDGTTAVNQQFTGDGTTAGFTLSQDPKSENNTHVYINGVYQQKTDYTVTGTTLTFDTAPANGDIIEVNMFTVATLGNTDTVTEGVSNQYFTNARARGAISVSGNAISYNSSTGVLTANFEEGPVFTSSVQVSGNNHIGIGGNDFNTTAGTNTLTVGTVGSTTGGIQLFSPTNGEHWINWGDTNSSTGRYRGRIGYNHTNDELMFYSSGTQKMVLDSNGNVGIGNSSPDELLHVKGTNGAIAIDGNGSGNTASIKFINDNERSRITSAYGSGGGGVLTFHTDTTGGSLLERMRIDASGNVGIGTNSPGYKLEVNGTAHVVNTLTAGAIGIPSQGITLNQGFGTGVPTLTTTGTATNGRAGAILFNEYGDVNCAAIYSTDGAGGNANYGGLLLATYQSDIRFSTSGLSNTRMIIKDDGKVGIGIATPGGLPLQTKVSSGDNKFRQTTANKDAFTLGLEDSTGDTIIGTHTTYPHTTFDDAGHVGINTGGTINGTGARVLQIESASSSALGPEVLIHNSGQGAAATAALTFGGKRSGNEGYTASIHTTNNDGLHFGAIAATNFSGLPTTSMAIRPDGDVHVAYTGSADTTGYFYAGKDWGATNHRINRNVSQGSNVLVISAYGGTGIFADTALFYAAATGGKNSAATAVGIEKNSVTSRSINAAGTLNASGNDYAEYMEKKSTAFEIAKGDICGVNENGKLTNKFTEAHSFVVKSTDPSYVGGDIWGNEDIVGKRPELTKQGYVNPEEKAAETDEEYAARKTKYEADLAEFEEKLEAQRIKYDRIAFSGQVPVNVTGATVGDYIIAKAGTSDSIIGEAVSSPTFEQYQLAVGKVWKILEDGRAFISVKIG